MQSNKSLLPALVHATTRHLRRAFSWDLQGVPVTEMERTKLMAAGLSQEFLHRFAAWRRSTLIVVLGPTFLAAILATLNALGEDRTGLSRVGKALTLASTLVLWAMPVSALLAIRSWTSLSRSHSTLVAGWTAAFLPPFLIALVPLGWSFTMTGTPEERANRQQELAVDDMFRGVYVAFTLLPTALSVLPGLVRSCIRIKTLVPASILPGWFLVTGPPFYLLLWLVALIVLNHLAGSPLLILGVTFWTGAPMLYVWRADLFVRPLRSGESSGILRVRRWANVVAALGALLLLIYLFTKQVFGLYLVGWVPQESLVWLSENLESAPSGPGSTLAQAKSLYWIGDVNLSQLCVQYFGRSLFLTTVFADLLLWMNLSLWRQEKQFSGTPESAAYDAAMSDLGRSLQPD